jgi:hypothetical protein
MLYEWNAWLERVLRTAFESRDFTYKQKLTAVNQKQRSWD